MIPLNKLIAFDVETQGEKQEYLLQPWRAATYEADIRMYSFAWFDEEGKIKTNLISPANRAALSDQFIRIAGQGQHIVGWNTPFDIGWLLGYGLRAEVFANKWLDAMLLWQRLETNKMRLKEDGWGKDKQVSFGLKAAVKEFFPKLAGYEEGLDFMDLSDAMTAKMAPYCRKDTAFTLVLTKLFLEKLTEREVMNALIEAAALPMVAEAWVSGLHLDVSALDTLAAVVTMGTEEARAKLLAESPELAEVNLGSPSQLAEVLFDKWGLTPLKKTPAGADSTDKETLYELAMIDPRAKLLKEVREGQNNFSKFVEGPRKSMAYHQEEITRPQPRIYGTYSGRMTYTSKQGKNSAEIPTGIALHQWKRGKEFRRVIAAPPGYVLAELDAAGQELRWMAIESGDPTMLDLCAPGEDAHSFMGAQVVQRDYRDLVRAVHADDVGAAKDRKLGKFCIAEGELVLTERGLVPIEQVTLADQVWDGVEWVRHEGTVSQGVQEVMTYDGLTATPDHVVYLQDGATCRLERAAETNSRIARSEVSGRPVRALGGGVEGFEARRSERRYKGILQMYLRQVFVGEYEQLKGREIDAMQRMCVEGPPRSARACNHQRGGDGKGAEEMQLHEATMRESKRRVVQELRGAWDSLLFRFSIRGYSLCAEGSTSPELYQSGHRSKGQQQALRAWKSAAGVKAGKSEQYTAEQILDLQRKEDSERARLSRTQDTVPGSKVCAEHVEQPRMCWDDNGRNRQPMVHPVMQTKRTYDLANAGPRHRFTVSGRLVSNCNLSYQYRVGIKTATGKARVEYDLDVDQDYISKTLKTYLRSYPGVENYWGRQIARARKDGRVWTLGGRKLDIRGNWAGRESWAMESSAINFPIQGVGADQKYLALKALARYINAHGIRFYMELHDGLFFLIPLKDATAHALKMQAILNALPYKAAWGFTPPIPLPWDLKMGPSWGDLKEVSR